MPGRSFTSEKYRFGFNGKEKDDELKGDGNSYDYGARMLDSRLGRFLSVDPFSVLYPHASSYCYVENNPIFRIDPNGENWFYYQAKGEEKNMWHWQKGTKATFTDINGKEATLSGGFENIVFYKTGRKNAFGATKGTIYVYQQDKLVLIEKGVFSGSAAWATNEAFDKKKGNAKTYDEADEGNYLMDLSKRRTMPQDQPGNTIHNPPAFEGIENIEDKTSVILPNGEKHSVNYDYGNGRIRINPVLINPKSGVISNASNNRGLYLHGKDAWYNRTHGCVCDKSENVFKFFWSGGGKEIRGKIPFVIGDNFIKPVVR